MTNAELDAMIADLRSPDTELFDVADAIAALREQVAAKDERLAKFAGMLTEKDSAIEKAEADNAAIRELMNVYNLGGWTDAIAPMKRALAAEADNAALREQVEAFRREQIARSKIDPVTRLHNLCDGLAESRHESPYDEASWELADADNKQLRQRAERAERENAALRQDAERIDFIETCIRDGSYASIINYIIAVCEHSYGTIGKGPALRTAIDAAIAKDKP